MDWIWIVAHEKIFSDYFAKLLDKDFKISQYNGVSQRDITFLYGTAPRLILIETYLGHSPGDGIDLAKKLRHSYQDTSIVLFGHSTAYTHFLQKLINGYIEKEKYESAKQALDLVLSGSKSFPNAMENAHRIHLSRRQMEIAKLLCTFHSNIEISKHLDISIDTVKYHVKVLHQKFNTRNASNKHKCLQRYLRNFFGMN